MINVFNTKKVSHLNPDMRVPKFLLPEPKKLDLGPKNGQIWPKIGIFSHNGQGLVGSFGALLVGWLVVVTGCISEDTYLLCIR